MMRYNSYINVKDIAMTGLQVQVIVYERVMKQSNQIHLNIICFTSIT